MPGWVSDSGTESLPPAFGPRFTKALGKKLLVLAALGFLPALSLLLSTCRVKDSPSDMEAVVAGNTSSPENVNEDVADLDGPDAPDEGRDVQDADSKARGPLPHPTSPSAWNTKVLIMTQPRPADIYLARCHNEIQAIAANAGSAETMTWAEKRIAAEIRGRLRLYHWCFYNSMMLLDGKLANDGMGLLLNDQVRNFNLAIKSLWILALALDRASGTRVYFDFLRARYLELARDFQGRDLMVLSPPFGRSGKPPVMDKKAGESAGDL